MKNIRFNVVEGVSKENKPYVLVEVIANVNGIEIVLDKLLVRNNVAKQLILNELHNE